MSAALGARAALCLAALTACAGVGGSAPAATAWPGAPAAAPLSPARLRARLDALLAPRDGGLHVGVHIVDVASGLPLYARRADEHFVPASCLKVLTGAAALAYLGPSYRFATDLLADSLERGGRTVRTLYLRGSGDPGLSEADLMGMALRLRQQGVTSVSGNLVLDDTAFEPMGWGHGWMWDDLPEGFSAPAGALNLAYNALTVTLMPGGRLDAPARLSLSPATPLFAPVNGVTTSTSSTTARVLPLPTDSPGLALGQGFTLSGQVSRDAGPWVTQIALRDGAMAAGQVLREQLRAQHIEVGGDIRRGVTPPDAVWLTSHASPELGAALMAYMKASNNHAMECLLRRLGANTTLGPGTASAGVRAVQAFVAQQVGLPPGELAIADGSGASRYSLITPGQLTTVLLAMHRSFAVGPEFTASLPIGGMDGTLANRFVVPLLHGRVRAKTGTMTGVANLAGYVEAPSGQVLAFAILIDGFVGSVEAQRRLHEAILLAVADPT